MRVSGGAASVAVEPRMTIEEMLAKGAAGYAAYLTTLSDEDLDEKRIAWEAQVEWDAPYGAYASDRLVEIEAEIAGRCIASVAVEPSGEVEIIWTRAAL